MSNYKSHDKENVKKYKVPLNFLMLSKYFVEIHCQRIGFQCVEYELIFNLCD